MVSMSVGFVMNRSKHLLVKLHLTFLWLLELNKTILLIMLNNTYNNNKIANGGIIISDNILKTDR